MGSLVLELNVPLDLGLTLGPLYRGPADPTIRLDGARVVRASRTKAGPATLALVLRGTTLLAEAWGSGAQAALAAGEFTGEADLLSMDGSTVSVQWAATVEVVTGHRLVLFVALSTSVCDDCSIIRLPIMRGLMHC